MTAENPAFGPVVPDKDRSIPPLDQHLKSLTIEKTRIGKVYDFLLGGIVKQVEAAERLGVELGETMNLRETALLSLVATEGYHELPNRKRLVELIEKAMPKEGAK